MDGLFVHDFTPVGFLDTRYLRLDGVLNRRRTLFHVTTLRRICRVRDSRERVAKNETRWAIMPNNQIANNPLEVRRRFSDVTYRCTNSTFYIIMQKREFVYFTRTWPRETAADNAITAGGILRRDKRSSGYIKRCHKFAINVNTIAGINHRGNIRATVHWITFRASRHPDL